jgi:prepilin-type N-terminal cleavage/methylation domain-containing protein
MKIKMLKRTKATASDQRGFTLIEIVVVMAIIGILAALLVPRFADVFGKGDQTAFDTDIASVTKAVEQFKLARHDGPDGSNEWGAGTANKRVYPPQDGDAGDIEIDLATGTADANGNLTVRVYQAGPMVGTAVGTDIAGSLIWLGLLVNEPVDLSGTSQQTTGGVAPQSGEDGEYLPTFPASAHRDNSTFDSGAATDGSYWYVILHSGLPAAVYENGGIYYAGSNQAYRSSSLILI